MKVLRILLVEDVETDAELAIRELQRSGIACVHQRVETADAFERALVEFEPDLLLSDFSLPQFDGLTALRIARERNPDLPFIFLSGTIGEERAAAALKSGATDYVLKTSLKRLPSAVERAVAEAEQRRVRRREQERIARLSRIQSVLSSMNAAIVRMRDRSELFRETCRIAVEHGLFRGAWIGVPDANTIEPVSWRFDHLPSNAERTGTFPGDAAGTLHSTLAIRTNRPSILNKVEHAAVGALEPEYRSLAALPIRTEGRAVAAFVVQAREQRFFDEDEMRLLTDVTGNLSLTLDYIAKEEQLRYLAYSDALTGIANKTLLNDRLEQAFAVSQRYAEPVAVILLDLDNFKFVNDSLGHSAGDELLRVIATRLKNAVNEGDTVARYAGDEFVLVLLKCGDIDAVRQRVHELRESVLRPVEVNGTEVCVTCSVGVSLYPEHGTEVSTLLKYANLAMHGAKEAGRNAVRVYTAGLNERVSERFSVDSHLRRALERGEFRLQYQPQIDLATRRIVGLEALIRWSNETLGSVSPARFIPIAEESGLILPIGEWTLRAACLQGRLWQRAGCPVKIAVNLSVLQFRQRRLVDMVAGILEETGLPSEHLELELTESAVMTSSDAATQMMNRLREIGVHFSIDDFGTGYSSLLYLKRFPASRLKIDQSFVQGLGVKSEDGSIVQAVISLAHSLNLRVVAEGVETEEQARYLAAHGCDEAQGYYFGRPLDPDDLTPLLPRA